MLRDAAELARIESFGAAFNEQISERVFPWSGGTAYIHDGLPKIWDANFLDLSVRGLTAREIAAQADEVMGPIGCEHRRVQVLDPEVGADLEAEFGALGWSTDVHVVMSNRREPNRKVDTSSVQEVGAAAWPGRAEQMRSYSSTDDPETVEQMRALYDLMTEVAHARDFAIVENGKAVSFALLLTDGSIGQIEDVATLEAYRNRGYSWRVMAKVMEESRATYDLTFLIADDRDWPKDFYSKLGFDAIGRHYYFLKKPQEEERPA